MPSGYLQNVHIVFLGHVESDKTLSKHKETMFYVTGQATKLHNQCSHPSPQKPFYLIRGRKKVRRKEVNSGI